MTAVIYHILRYPSVWVEIVAELDALGASYPVSYAQAQGLPYLTAGIREALRIHPTAGIELERRVDQGGLVLPTGGTLSPGTMLELMRGLYIAILQCSEKMQISSPQSGG